MMNKSIVLVKNIDELIKVAKNDEVIIFTDDLTLYVIYKKFLNIYFLEDKKISTFLELLKLVLGIDIDFEIAEEEILNFESILFSNKLEMEISKLNQERIKLDSDISLKSKIISRNNVEISEKDKLINHQKKIIEDRDFQISEMKKQMIIYNELLFKNNKSNEEKEVEKNSNLHRKVSKIVRSKIDA